MNFCDLPDMYVCMSQPSDFGHTYPVLGKSFMLMLQLLYTYCRIVLYTLIERSDNPIGHSKHEVTWHAHVTMP